MTFIIIFLILFLSDREDQYQDEGEKIEAYDSYIVPRIAIACMMILSSILSVLFMTCIHFSKVITVSVKWEIYIMLICFHSNIVFRFTLWVFPSLLDIFLYSLQYVVLCFMCLTSVYVGIESRSWLDIIVVRVMTRHDLTTSVDDAIPIYFGLCHATSDYEYSKCKHIVDVHVSRKN